MKKLTIVLAFVLLAVALFAINAVAAQPNIANQAEVSTSSGCWVVRDNLAALTDGNREKGTGSSHNDGSYTLTFKYAQNMQFEKIVIVVNSKGSTAAGSWSEVTNNNFKLGVRMQNIYGEIVHEENYQTGDLTEIVVTPDAYVSQIILTVNCGWNNQLAIWELEAYGCVAHDCDFKLTETKTAPTCGADGLGVYTCSICNETKEDTIPATGDHSWNEGVITTAPTDSSSGIKTYTCSVCQATKEEVLAATGHNWDGGVVVAPKCDEQGYTLYTCTDDGCEATYKGFFVDAIGHAYDDGVETKHPTLVADGELTFSCTREGCDEAYTKPIPKAVISDSSFVIGLDQIISSTEEVKGTKGDKSDYTHLFDGNTANATWSQSNPGGWYLPSGSSMTIVFDEEYYILSFNFYIWSNYGGVRIEFFDASGSLVATYLNNGLQGTDGSAHVISDCVEKSVKSMKVSILHAKGDTGNCFDFQEFVIKAHKHLAEGETERYDEIIGCTENGSYKKYCYTCEKEVVVETKALGSHELNSVVQFANGLDRVGTVDQSCNRCGYEYKSRIQPVFSSYGYSVREFGGSAIVHKYEVNLESLEFYNSTLSAGADFGIVAAATPNFEGSPLVIVEGAVAKANDKVAFKSFANTGVVSFEYAVTNIPEAAYDTGIVLCAYVYDGEKIVYINANTDSGEEFETVSFNDLIS